jgi:hypothetical protein
VHVAGNGGGNAGGGGGKGGGGGRSWYELEGFKCHPPPGRFLFIEGPPHRPPRRTPTSY